MYVCKTVNLDLPVFTTLTPSTTTIESDTAFVTVTVGAAGMLSLTVR